MLGSALAQTDNECAVNADCLDTYGEGFCCGDVTCTVTSGRRTEDVPYTSRCYYAVGIDVSTTIEYVGTSDCSQQCTSYDSLSAASTGDDGGDDSGDDSMGTPEVVTRREFECKETISQGFCCYEYAVDDSTSTKVQVWSSCVSAGTSVEGDILSTMANNRRRTKRMDAANLAVSTLALLISALIFQ